MKKKLTAIVAVLMALSLSACSPDKAKEEGKKIKKDLEEKVEDLKDDVSKYVDDETDLEALTGTSTSTSEELSGAFVSEPKEDFMAFTTSESAEDSTDEYYSPDIIFTISDLDGNTINENEFSKHKVTMINFWEPWCGPCVSEMPEIEKLYENYKDKGLYIIGVFSATDQLDDVKSVVKSAGTTYPIAIYDQAFDIYQTGYVPTTIFIDQNGHILPASNGYSEHAIVGANSYENWAELVESFLK